MNILSRYLPNIWFLIQRFFLINIDNICEFTRYTSKINYFNFYLTKSDKQYLKFKKYFGEVQDNFIRIRIGKRTIFITNGLFSFKKLLMYFKNICDKINLENEMTETLSLSFYELKRIENENYLENEIKTYFDDIEIMKHGVIIRQTIYPDKVLYGKPPRLYKLPIEFSIPINSIQITTDTENQITSIKIDAKHPNCDSMGYMCVDKTEKKKLNIDSIEEIIFSIKTYNFVSPHYFFPKNLKISDLERMYI